MKIDVSVILPTYNESEHIKDLINEIDDHLVSYGIAGEIIIVDDNSPDLTWQVVGNLEHTQSMLTSLRRTNERGLTTALNFGIEHARGSILVWMDADFSHPPSLIPTLLEPVLSGSADATIASRYIYGGADERNGSSTLQKLLSHALSFLSRKLLRTNIYDVSSGFIAVKRTMLPFPLHGFYGEYFLDLIVRLERSDARLKEIPYICQDRRTGISKTAPNVFTLLSLGRGYLKTLLHHIGSYPNFADTSEKADNRPGGMSWQRTANTRKSSNVKQ